AWGTYDEDILKYTLFFPESGYLLQATSIYKQSEDDYIVPDYVTDLIEHRDYLLHFSQLVLYHPSDASGKRDLEFESDLDSFLSLYMLEKVPDKPVIYMVQVAGNTFTLKSHPVNDNFEIKDLDVNYGYGFEKFHTDLMKRFMHKTKGLVLFHGEPGTGKTFYIRHLLRKMASLNKVVIYMPPNMVDHLVDPSFMTFISQQVGYYSSQGYFCALLIEDAEPLLAARQTEIRNQGVTNLLNMTDGLLNDMLNLQIICTFNVNVKELDKALLRPGRLIARKEFKALSELDANLLAQRLGIKHHFNGPATLSEIYAMLKDNSTITHDVDEIELDF
ncbi:MAG: AAA family ATPase, partial [Bacteroidetes bacterium]|nr:AAA family ATPase [Bacteroidota bacterium]